MENKVLLESLNKTKASSMTIAESLQDAHRIQTTLDQVRINLCQVLVNYVQNKTIFFAFSRSHQHVKVKSMIVFGFGPFSVSLSRYFPISLLMSDTASRLIV